MRHEVLEPSEDVVNSPSYQRLLQQQDLILSDLESSLDTQQLKRLERSPDSQQQLRRLSLPDPKDRRLPSAKLNTWKDQRRPSLELVSHFRVGVHPCRFTPG